MSPGRSLAVAGLALAAALGVGCAPVGQNVRAYRAYAHEDASLKVSLDRIEDLARTLELVDRVLTAMPYTPGDIWIRRLPMTDAELRVTRDDIKTENPYKFGEYEVPILKCYRRHIENVLDEYRPPPEKAMYPSVLDAVSGLVPRAPSIKAHWTAYRAAGGALATAIEQQVHLEQELSGLDEAARTKRAGELAEKKQKRAQAEDAVESAKGELARDAALMQSDAQLNDAQKKQIGRDAFTAISVAFRVDLEALALAPIVAIQTVRSIPQAPHELITTPTLKIVRQAWQLPGYITGIKERLSRQVVVLEGITGILAKALGTSIDESPGMALRESIVDQVVGITLDSIRVDLRAGGEAFIFSSIATAAQQSTTSDNGNKSETYDYRGRRFKLDYRVQPILLASARLDLVLDWIRLPGVAALAFGYSTDRIYKSGGEIEQSSLSQQLGIKGAVSDVFDIGLGILGIRSSAKIARFTGGELRQVQATDVSQIVSKAPLQLTMTQIDVGYDMLWATGSDSLKAWLEELVVGVRYFKYALPRILYELRNSSSDPSHKTFVFARESPIQAVDSQYYMAGFSARIGVGESPRLSPFADLALFGGAGPSNFYFLRDGAAADTEANRDASKQIAWVVNGGIGVGLRWRLLPRGFRARLDLRAIYRADFVYTQIQRTSTDKGEERRTDFGSIDVFHGPTLAIRGAF